MTNIFTEPDPHLHAAARRKIAAAYSMTSLVQMESFVDDCTTVLKTKLEQFAASGASIDISHWMQCYAFDVIGKITVRSFTDAPLAPNRSHESSRPASALGFSTLERTFKG